MWLRPWCSSGLVTICYHHCEVLYRLWGRLCRNGLRHCVSLIDLFILTPLVCVYWDATEKHSELNSERSFWHGGNKDEKALSQLWEWPWIFTNHLSQRRWGLPVREKSTHFHVRLLYMLTEICVLCTQWHFHWLESFYILLRRALLYPISPKLSVYFCSIVLSWSCLGVTKHSW